MTTDKTLVVEELRRLLVRLVCSLVNDVRAVRVEAELARFHTTFNVCVADDDFKRLVGREWMYFNTLRVMFKSLARAADLPQCDLYAEDPRAREPNANSGQG